jgi:hypothetical protein
MRLNQIIVRTVFVAVLLVLGVVAAFGQSVRESQPRIVFDSLGNRGRPVAPVGAPVVCRGDWFTPASRAAYLASVPRDPKLLVPDESLARANARRARDAAAILIINIEAWSFDSRRMSGADLDLAVATVGQIVGWIRDEAPNVRVGYYAFLPNRDWWTPVNDAAARASTHAWWVNQRKTFADRVTQWTTSTDRLLVTPSAQAVEDQAVGFADLFDFTCPSLYLFYADSSPESVVAYARANIAQARRAGHAVYPFVMSKLHGSPWPMVPLRQWIALCRTVATDADGIVLWGDQSPWDAHHRVRIDLARLLMASRGTATNAELMTAIESTITDEAILRDLRPVLAH